MRLVNDWRREGIALTFAQLIERPYLKHWLQLLETVRPNAPTETAAWQPDSLEASTPIDGAEAFGLTDVQYAYWVGRQDGQPLGGVGCHAYLELEGRGIDPSRLEGGWQQLFRQHAMLRTRFGTDGTQCVCEDLAAPPLRTHDFRHLAANEAEARLLAVRDRLSHRRLDVAIGEVAGPELSLLPGGGTCIHFDIDLLVADVQSLHILLRDLAAAYQGQALRADPDSEIFPISEQRGSAGRRAGRYCAEVLAGQPGQTASWPRLPLVKTPENVVRPRFVRRRHQLPARLGRP
ncbi:condensation domain-containing protein [Pseudomonas aeruginosa]|nr:condensation domain-containing protein [Pseudomonas aeruginosa]